MKILELISKNVDGVIGKEMLLTCTIRQHIKIDEICSIEVQFPSHCCKLVINIQLNCSERPVPLVKGKLNATMGIF